MLLQTLRKLAYKECRGFLWIEHMEAPNEAFGKGITHFFIQKASCNAFFGSWKRPSAIRVEDEDVFRHEYRGSGRGVVEHARLQ